MSHSLKSDSIQHFDRQYFARPRRVIVIALLGLLVAQAAMVAVIVSSESTKLDRGRLLVEECPTGLPPSSIILKKSAGACQVQPISFDTKV